MTRVKLTYFKDTGKYYAEGEYLSIHDNSSASLYSEVRYWWLGETPLPGLSSRWWDGYILVHPEDGVPALIDLCDE